MTARQSEVGIGSGALQRNIPDSSSILQFTLVTFRDILFTAVAIFHLPIRHVIVRRSLSALTFGLFMSARLLRW